MRRNRVLGNAEVVHFQAIYLTGYAVDSLDGIYDDNLIVICYQIEYGKSRDIVSSQCYVAGRRIFLECFNNMECHAVITDDGIAYAEDNFFHAVGVSAGTACGLEAK